MGKERRWFSLESGLGCYECRSLFVERAKKEEGIRRALVSALAQDEEDGRLLPKNNNNNNKNNTTTFQYILSPSFLSLSMKNKKTTVLTRTPSMCDLCLRQGRNASPYCNAGLSQFDG